MHLVADPHARRLRVFRAPGGGDLVRKRVVDERRRRSQIDGAPVPGPATRLPRVARLIAYPATPSAYPHNRQSW